MLDLIAFLHARLKEDEEVALRAAEWPGMGEFIRPEWHVQQWADPDQTAVVAHPESSAYPIARMSDEQDGEPSTRAIHVARHDPARILREVEAKRQLLKQYEDAETGFRDWREGYENGLQAAVQVLALPYSSHPDYREEWRP